MISTREKILQDSILYICRNSYKPLLDKSNVVGVGMGYRQINGFSTNQLSIHVLVKQKLPEDYLPRKQRIPNVYKGHKTDVVEIGEITEAPTENLPKLLVARVRPLIGGYCIMAGGLSTGSMSCVVKKRTRTGYDYFILGNNHVLSARNRLPIGSPIIQPSTDFGGDPIRDKVAELTKYIPTKDKTRFRTPTNYVDCAIAKILDVSNISNSLALEGPIMGVASAGLGDAISKVGMVTGLTNGIVKSVGVTAEIKSADGQHVALYKGITRADIRNNGGDSGALVINPARYAVGLYFSGARVISAFFCSMARSLRELEV